VKYASRILFGCVAALLVLGMVMLFSASTGHTGHKQTSYLLMQPIWCAVGLLACWLAATIDYRWLKAYPWVPWAILLFACSLLVLVLVPGIKVTINGASRWLKAGPFTMQPSELAKIALIIMLAHYGERYQRWMPTFWKGMVVPCAIVGVVLGLIFVEPDVGTALLLGTVSSIVLLIAGIRWRYFVPPVLVALVGLGVFLWQNPMRSERIYSWLHLEETKQDKGLQAYQAMVALGSGGVTGVGLGDGRQKLGRIPEHHTDFILSVIGEELGLSATLFVIAAFITITICGVYIAWHACDTFGMLVASGITFLIGLQAVINIGVVTGSLPNKGLSLPFISYGGSNLVVMLTCVGVLGSIARRGVEPKRASARIFGSKSAALSYS
jgi:cell division protein FtsW